MKRASVLLIAAILLLAYKAEARSWRPGQLPNAPASCNTCHTTGGGTARNLFGLAVEARVDPGSTDPFWGPELAQLDSDGDGVPNGVELGDPEGDGIADINIPVTHPGDPNDFVEPQMPTFDEWLASQEAVDLSGDGLVDIADYYVVFPNAWFDGPDAVDLNADGIINFDDFFLWANEQGPPPPPPFDEWLASAEAQDMDGDGIVNIVDYELFFGLPSGQLPSSSLTFDEWLGGPEAQDMNGDGLVDEIDFYLFDPFSWINGPSGEDLDGNGVVGFDDFAL